MKNFSLPRLGLVLWFFNYAVVLSLLPISFGVAGEIMPRVLSATFFMIIELMAIGVYLEG